MHKTLHYDRNNPGNYTSANTAFWTTTNSDRSLAYNAEILFGVGCEWKKAFEEKETTLNDEENAAMTTGSRKAFAFEATKNLGFGAAAFHTIPLFAWIMGKQREGTFNSLTSRLESIRFARLIIYL